MNTPATPGESTPVDPLDDVFGSAPASPTHINDQDNTRTSTPETTTDASGSRHADLSDIPRLRSTHITNGYREGIAASKENFIQEGFDEGYALGAEVGMKAGWCLGALEGILRALPASPRSGAESDGVEVTLARKEDASKMLTEAEEALKVSNLFGAEYFGADGIWLYDIPAKDGGESEEVTFAQVAEAHPTIKKWADAVLGLTKTLGLVLE